LNSRFYKTIGIDWLIKKLCFLVCGYINALSFTCNLNHLNASSMEKVVIILLQLRRLNWNYARLCSTLILQTLLCESCFVSYIKVLVDIIIFSY